jgi:hypothetical protein
MGTAADDISQYHTPAGGADVTQIPHLALPFTGVLSLTVVWTRVDARYLS